MKQPQFVATVAGEYVNVDAEEYVNVGIAERLHIVMVDRNPSLWWVNAVINDTNYNLTNNVTMSKTEAVRRLKAIVDRVNQQELPSDCT